MIDFKRIKKLKISGAFVLQSGLVDGDAFYHSFRYLLWG